MLGSAFKITAFAVYNIILVVFATLRSRDCVASRVDAVRRSCSGTSRLPLDVLKGVSTVDNFNTVLAPSNLLGHRIINVASLGII